jgi:site-specific DNA-cytosine methylase
MHRAVDCQGYAGAFSVAVRNAGFDIIGKVEQPDQYGIGAWERNLEYLAPNCERIYAGPPDTWPFIPDVTLLFGNPPCSAFSNLMADPKFLERGQSGIGGVQNQCMWDLVEYGARLDAPIVAFESVRQAGIKGLPLMHALHDYLQERTGKDYTLTIVFLNALSVGGKQRRPRMFWIASRLGPIATPPTVDTYPSLATSILHLAELESEDPTSPNSYVRNKRFDRLRGLLDWTHWDPGEYASVVYARAIEAGMPEWKGGRADKIQSPYQARRWFLHKPSAVLTGGAMDEIMHPTRPRGFTYREVAELSGLPPEYDLSGIIEGGTTGRSLFGKATPVESASYVARAIWAHLEDDEMPIQPTEYESGRWRVDVTDAFKKASMIHDGVTLPPHNIPAAGGRGRPRKPLVYDRILTPRVREESPLVVGEQIALEV